MKKWKSILLISAVCTLCAFPVQASEVNPVPVTPIPTEAPTVTPQPTLIPPKPAEKNGWVKLSRNRKRYYRNGKLLKGMHKIEGKRCRVCTGISVKKTVISKMNVRTVDVVDPKDHVGYKDPKGKKGYKDHAARKDYKVLKE